MRDFVIITDEPVGEIATLSLGFTEKQVVPDVADKPYKLIINNYNGVKIFDMDAVGAIFAKYDVDSLRGLQLVQIVDATAQYKYEDDVEAA